MYHQAVFSPDGRQIAATIEKTVYLWEVETGQLLQEIKGDFLGANSVQFDHGGQRIVTGGDNRTVKLWDTRTGLEITTLKGYRWPVEYASFSPDDLRLAVAEQDVSVKIWDVQMGRELLALEPPSTTTTNATYYAAFSPDGSRVATIDVLGRVFVWHSVPWKENDLPGNANLSYEERLKLYKLSSWKERLQKAVLQPASQPDTETVPVTSSPETAQEKARKLEGCAENFRKIHAALTRYRDDHNGRMPDWLFDLVPDYITTQTLRCPSEHGDFATYAPDPRLPCSYEYQFSARFIEAKGETFLQWKTAELKKAGDRVPTVRCRNHNMGSGFGVLNLSYGGRIYKSGHSWSLRWEDYQSTSTDIGPPTDLAPSTRAVPRDSTAQPR